MANDSSTIRIVSKSQYDQQTFLAGADLSLKPLAANSIRVRPRLIGIGSNNLSYCANGTLLHWWNAYPIPTSVPEPYNDNAMYGIAPGWGFADVTDTTIPALNIGTVVMGFLPLASMLVDLQLRQVSQNPKHWLETSSHRQDLMPLYQRYCVVGSDMLDSQNEVLAAWMCTLRPVWECGLLLNRFCFPAKAQRKPIHPSGIASLPWTQRDSDLSSSLVVTLGAGSKTSRSLVHQMITNRTTNSGPVGLMEVTSTESSILDSLKPSMPHKTMSYSDATSTDTMEWIGHQNASRIVVCDCGGRNNFVERFTNTLRGKFALLQIDVMSIGGEAKVYDENDKLARLEAIKKLQSPRVNTSGIRTLAMEQQGEKSYFEQMETEFQRVIETELAREIDTVLGISLDIRTGVTDLEQTWTSLCQGQIPGTEGVVVRL